MAQLSTRVLARTSVFAALVALGTAISIPMPPPLTTINLGPLLIFLTAILLGPIPGLLAGAIGSGVGLWAASTLNLALIPPGFFGIFIIGIVSVRGTEGLIVGALRKLNEPLAMIIGGIWEIVVFFLLDWILFGFLIAIAVTATGTAVDLIYVPIGIVVIRLVRSRLRTKYLDEQQMSGQDVNKHA